MTRASPHPFRAAAAGRQGFTLVEMLVVLSVLALVLAAGVATIPRRGMTPGPEQSARQLQAMLLQARSEAIRQGRDTSVVIDLASRSFAFPDRGRAAALPRGTEMTVRAALVGGTADARRATVTFRADGSASGGEINLVDARGRRAGVAVDWFTGLARLLPPAGP